MFKLVWARSPGRGRTHRPGPGSGRLWNREAAAGRSRGSQRRGSGAWLLCSPGRGIARPGRAEQGFGESSRPGGLCVSALPASHFGDGEAARPQIAGRASACSGSLAGRDGATALTRTSRCGRPHPRGPRPRSGLEAAPGPRPGPSHLPAAPLCSRAPRRAHDLGEGPLRARLPSPAPACSAARAPGSALRDPARRYNRRRRIVPSEEADRERRRRASLACGRHLVAAALSRSLPGAEEGT